jgi:outer membrane protein assembly factor BamD
MVQNAIRYIVLIVVLGVLLGGCGIRRKKYDNPITKDTQQPDKVLFDKAVNDIEHSRFEIARLLLQNLINTYDTSEYLAKAKLAIADAWYREGGSHGLAQAEAEYKDFILFYPAMEESAEAQEKVCDIHYKQMDKPDRDPMHALRAEAECKQLIVQFPNSKFAPLAQQKLRDIQEVLADSEFRVGTLYAHKGSFPAAANRFQALSDQFPLYSKADEALWQAAESYHRMGDRFENQQVSAYSRIVKDYPLSTHVEDARAQLQVMKRPVPEADPVAYARMKYEIENHDKRSKLSHALGIFRGSPDMSQAAKSGTPPMDGLRPTIPASVPPPAAPGLGTNEVSITAPGADSAIDKGAEVRAQVAPAAPQAAVQNAAPATDPNAAAQNATLTPAQQRKAAQEMTRKQQQAQKKAIAERKKLELERQQKVREQKKKSKQQELDKQQPDKQQPAPAPAPTGGQGGAAAPAKQ